MSLNVLTQGGGTGGASASIFVTGLSEADTVTASKGGKTANGKWMQKPNPECVVPAGYTQLEYIESTGTQYINTGIKATSSIGVEIDYSDYVVNGNENVLFGASNGSWAAQLGMNNSKTQGQTLAYYNYDGYTGYAIQNACKYKLENGALYANGTQIYSKTFSSFSYTYNIYLLAQNWAGAAQNYAKLKLKSAKVWDNSALIRDFIPAKRNSDGVIGLYDIVGNVFYTNSGTGTFVGGAEIPQYIDGHAVTVKSYGMWTVTATNGEQTETQDVLIDAAVEYEIEMSYKLWLYREGDECEEVTGGWSSPTVKSGYNWDCKNTADATRTAVKNSDNLQIEMALAANTGSAYASASYWTAEQIDLTGISAIKCDIYVTNSVCTLAVNNSNPLNTTISILNALSKSVGATTVGERSIVTLDVSDLTGAYCIGFFVAHYTRSKVAQGGKIYNVWLE